MSGAHGDEHGFCTPRYSHCAFKSSSSKVMVLSSFEFKFEAVSGFTSTGFTIFENIKHIDQGLIIWRSSIQWIGGLYFLFSIIFLIDIYDENLKKGVYEPVTLKQEFRDFDNESPWEGMKETIKEELEKK